MAPHYSTLAWKIPWTEEPGGLQSMGSLRVGHDWATSLSISTFHFHALEKEMATTQVLLPGESQGRGSWWAAIHGVAQSWTRLKWFSSSSSSSVHWYISVLIWMKSNLYIFIAIYIFGIISKKSLLNAILWSFSPVFSSTTFIVLLIALKVLDPFGSIFVEGKLSLFHCWVLCWLWFFIWLLLCWDFP